jgi:hypothetical protein
VLLVTRHGSGRELFSVHIVCPPMQMGRLAVTECRVPKTIISVTTSIQKCRTRFNVICFNPWRQPAQMTVAIERISTQRTTTEIALTGYDTTARTYTCERAVRSLKEPSGTVEISLPCNDLVNDIALPLKQPSGKFIRTEFSRSSIL